LIEKLVEKASYEIFLKLPLLFWVEILFFSMMQKKNISGKNI